MNVRVVLLAAALGVTGFGLVVYKVTALGYELVPQSLEDRWVVQIQVRLRGSGDRARIRLYLPGNRPGQRVYDERVLSEGMRLYIRPRGGNRAGYLSDRLDGSSTVGYRFSVHLEPVEIEVPAAEAVEAQDPGAVDARYLATTKRIQSGDPRVAARLREVTDPAGGVLARVRSVFEYVTDEVVEEELDEASDALTVLQRERGGALGKARLLVALLRAAGVPARVMGGFDLAEGDLDELAYWAEAYLAGSWYPLDPTAGRLGALPARRLAMFEGDRDIIWSKGVEVQSFRVSALREEVSQHRLYERRVRRSDSLVDGFSLFTLPLRSQLALRILLLLPFGALVVAVFRNLVGVTTFGTFMPVLIALAFLGTSLPLGIFLLLTIIGVGWLFRSFLDRLQLLMIPRLAFLLTVVIGIVVGISLISERLGLSAGLSVTLFPIVILTATIERFSIIVVEEGTRNALKATLGTLVVATACYGLLVNEPLQRVVLAFPELLLVVLALLLLLGRYTGYRLSEWLRFSAFRAAGGSK